jgi:uncharacterized phage protein (TIGR02218 family)
MRQFPQNFTDHLASGATTLCRCWKLVGNQGNTLGFTDHDCDLTINGLTYAAMSGMEGAEVETQLGLAIGGTEISGALNSDALTDTQISAGVWDNATVETWLVNWADVTTKILLDIGQIGEIRRSDHGFTAEMRGLASKFDEDRGRIFQSGCNADLGDTRCGVNLELPAYKATGTITKTDGRLTFDVPLSTAYANGWFEGGSVSFSAGGNAGAIIEIRQHLVKGLIASIVLWRPAPAAITIGDSITLRAGCDKRLETCRAKFSNALNFRGCPFIPSTDFVLTYGKAGDSTQTGGTLL